jgi:protease IV
VSPVERDTRSRARRIRHAALTVAAVVLLTGLTGFALSLAARLEPQDMLAWTVAATAVLLAVAAAAKLHARRVPPRAVLELDFQSPVRDVGGPLSFVSARRGLTLRDVVETLERAETDPRVAGLFARVGKPATGPADLDELRQAVLSFRRSGRFAVAFVETFGEFGDGNEPYRLAAAFDEIHLQPSGTVGLTGPAAIVGFLRGTLDKLGIEPLFEHRHEYKSAKNRLTETSFTDPHREATDRIVASLDEHLVADVASGRGLTPDDVRALIDRAPLLAEEALAAGLVDRLSYRDEALAAAGARAGDDARLVRLDDYRGRTRRRRRRAPVVALVHGTGPVVQGRSRPTPFGLRSLASDAVAGALRAAAEDKKVRAILFRVDSPGGSAVASDVVWREVRRAREAGKPVVASMGNVAGSGGYFVAMAADRIVAHRGTLTGSIGVVAGKAVVREAKAKFGLTSDEAHRGAHALMWSADHPYGDGERARLSAWLDHVYDDFTAKVAEARGLTVARVHEIARGRVWTGADALEIGLVDRLGGYREALADVRDLAGLDADVPVRVVTYPRRPPVLSRLLGRDQPAPAGTVLGPLGSVADAARTARNALGSGGALRAPDRWV